MKDVLVPKLDPLGTGTLTREAWRTVSAEWHASGKSFLDFIITPQLRRRLSEEGRNILAAKLVGRSENSTSGEAGTWRKADMETIKKRKIVKMSRNRLPQAVSVPAPAPAPSAPATPAASASASTSGSGGG